MKTFEKYLSEATEAQVRAQNPNASPEMVRRAAERSQRSAAQREGNQKRQENDIKKGKKSLSGKGEIVKGTSNLAARPSSALAKRSDKGGALAKTKPNSSKLALKKKPSSALAKRSDKGGALVKTNSKKPYRKGETKNSTKKGGNNLWDKLKGTRGQEKSSASADLHGLKSQGTQI